MVKFFLWCILLVLCWPLALLALVLYPLIWLLLLPFRLVGIAVGGVFELLGAIITLPARVLRSRDLPRPQRYHLMLQLAPGSRPRPLSSRASGRRFRSRKCAPPQSPRGCWHWESCDCARSRGSY